MEDKTLELKAELYDLNKELANQSAIINQIAQKLKVQSLEALLEKLDTLVALEETEVE